MEIKEILYLILSVAIGAVIVEIFKPKKSRNIQLLLTFSGAYLLAVSLLHLIPELFGNHSSVNLDNDLSKNIGIFILGGFLIQILLEYFSKGIEHGHFHKQKVIPITVLISLCFHALLEGIPLGGGLDHNHSGSRKCETDVVTLEVWGLKQEDYCQSLRVLIETLTHLGAWKIKMMINFLNI